MSLLNKPLWIPANWPAPEGIRAGSTTRQTGFSLPPYATLNLAQHVGDEVLSVEQNRDLLRAELLLPSTPLWLQQDHGKQVIDDDEWSANVSADACYTNKRSIVCAILTADCLPLLLCSKDGRELAAIHLGWRGLCQNIIDAALSRFDTDHGNILAWIGPHIHSNNYEVGELVRCACLQAFPGMENAFISTKAGHWLASLETLVRHDLANKGLSMIYSCNECTFDDEDRFFSYRRENPTGRMASLIWKET